MRTSEEELIDRAVGAAVRDRRIELRLSQGHVARALGVSFQQVQKIETGLNRLGAGRLAILSDLLSVPVQHFFENSEAQAVAPGTAPLPRMTRQDGRMLAAFRSLPPELRSDVLSLVEDVIGASDTAQPGARDAVVEET